MPLSPTWTESLSPHNFMLQDLAGSVAAVVVFGAVFYAPGYLLAYAADLFGFRRADFAERSLWAIGCSFSVVPIAAYLTARACGLTCLCRVLLACALAAFLFLCMRKAAWPRRDRWFTAWAVLCWTVFALAMLIEVQAAGKLYFSVAMADDSYRIAFTDTVARTGVPPTNPLYFAGAAAPMRYYYFWYVLCAAVMKLAHISARQAFVASTVWAGFGLLATVQLFSSHFFHWKHSRRGLALGLLLVGGADLLPALGNLFLQQSINGDTEWWSVDPVDGWPDSLLWVPHHVASVLCCLLALLFLWRARRRVSRTSKLWAVILAAAAFASAFGLSVYVAFGFALLMSAWLVRLLLTKHPERREVWVRVMTASLLSVAILLPFLRELHTGSMAAPNGAAAQRVFSLSVRRMIDSGLLTGLPVFASLNRSHPVLLDQSLRLLLLIPGLAMELGIYGAVLVLLWMARRRHEVAPDEARDTALFFAVTGLALTMFLSSAVITNNDFGYRAVMLPQFFLLLLTADVLGSWWTAGGRPVLAVTPARRRPLYALLGLGAVGMVYWAILLRAWLPLEVARAQDGFSRMPEDNFEVREAFVALDRVAPKDAVVAFHSIPAEVHPYDEVMTPNEFYQRMLVMDTGRQMLNAEYKCATHFGGDPGPCAVMQRETDALYATVPPEAGWARNYCRRFGVQYLVLNHRDPSWNSTSGWPAMLPLTVEQPGLKILQCK